MKIMQKPVRIRVYDFNVAVRPPCSETFKLIASRRSFSTNINLSNCLSPTSNAIVAGTAHEVGSLRIILLELYVTATAKASIYMSWNG